MRDGVIIGRLQSEETGQLKFQGSKSNSTQLGIFIIFIFI